MPPSPHASIGIALDEVDTPALVLDLDVLGRNLLRMAEAVKGSGVRLRPHAKATSAPRSPGGADRRGRGRRCAPEVSEAERRWSRVRGGNGVRRASTSPGPEQ